MENALEKCRSRLVRLLFPIVQRFYLVIALILIVAVWFTFSIPQPSERTKLILLWLTITIGQIYWSGIRERDYLPAQPGSGLFYRAYRIADQICFLFYFIWLIFLLIPESLSAGRVVGTAARVFVCLFIVVLILRAAGERKYRPKKSKE